MPHKNDAVWLIAQYWPGLAIALAFLGWLASHGFIDNVAHESAIEKIRLQMEANERRNQDAHEHMGADITEIKEGVNRLIDAHIRKH